MRVGRLFIAMTLISALASGAHAQSVEAETLFVEGEKQMTAGRYDEACEAFAASNRIEPRAGTLINLGLCQEKRGKLASAWIAFREALTRVKDPAKKAFATEHAAALEPRLSWLTIDAPGAVDGLVITRDGQPLDRALFGRAIPVDGGTHAIEARAPQRRAWTSQVEVAAERARVTVSVPPLTADVVAVVPVAPPQRNRHLALALGLTGVAVGSLGVGVWAGLSARDLHDDATALCPTLDAPCAQSNAANALLDRRDDRALIANVAFGAAAAGIVVATIVYVLGRPDDDARPTAAFVAHPGGGGVMVRFGF